MIIKRPRPASVFIVDGTLDGQPYTCQVGGDDPLALGAVTGTRNVMDLLVRRTGDWYAATPTGPFGTLSLSKPESVLGALLNWTQVDMVSGDAPDILGGQRDQPGVVY